jgi:hypothetical protein
VSPSNETELLTCIVDLAASTGWWLHHDRPARTEHGWRTAVQGNAGFPDCLLGREGVVLIRELKGRYEKLTSAQLAWAQRLAPGWREDPARDTAERMVLPFDVWRPRDWDLIVATLTSRQAAHAIR